MEYAHQNNNNSNDKREKKAQHNISTIPAWRGVVVFIFLLTRFVPLLVYVITRVWHETVRWNKRVKWVRSN